MLETERYWSGSRARVVSLVLVVLLHSRHRSLSRSPAALFGFALQHCFFGWFFCLNICFVVYFASCYLPSSR